MLKHHLHLLLLLTLLLTLTLKIAREIITLSGYSRRVAGNNTVLRVYLIECLPMRKRGTCLAIIDMFWMIGYVLALGKKK